MGNRQRFHSLVFADGCSKAAPATLPGWLHHLPHARRSSNRPKTCGMAHELLTIEATIRGYHMYKEIWCADVHVGELELSCMREVENYRNPFAVTVVRYIDQSMATPPANRVCGGSREFTRRLSFCGFNFGGLPINRENWTPRKFPAIR